MAFPYEMVGYSDGPDRTGVCGVLGVKVNDGVLSCTWHEVAEAINRGWVVTVFDGEGASDLVSEAKVDESGSDPVYKIKAGSKTYSCSRPDEEPESAGGDSLVGSAIVGTSVVG